MIELAKKELDLLKEDVVYTLTQVKRAGIDKLVDYITNQGFFTSPASINYHGNYPGGLLQHSINVLDNFTNLKQEVGLGSPVDSDTIACLLHDLCKANSYNQDENGKYSWNMSTPRGHGSLSVARIKEHIKLTEEEEAMVLYHMGPWGTVQVMGSNKGDYSILSMTNAWKKFQSVRLIYFADELATMQEGLPYKTKS